MIIPERPIKGMPVPQGWFCDFYDYVMSMKITGDGRTFFVKKTDQGCVGSTKPEGAVAVTADSGSSSASSASIPAQISSKDGAVYNVALYANGVNSASTGNATVYVLQLNFSDTLPNGTWIIATPSAMEIVGGESVP